MIDSLAVDSFTMWEDFVKALLKKFYPIHKIALIKKNIMQFRQEQSEPFWRYFERFQDLLIGPEAFHLSFDDD